MAFKIKKRVLSISITEFLNIKKKIQAMYLNKNIYLIKSKFFFLTVKT